jgi:hypothetical protein
VRIISATTEASERTWEASAGEDGYEHFRIIEIMRNIWITRMIRMTRIIMIVRVGRAVRTCW